MQQQIQHPVIVLAHLHTGEEVAIPLANVNYVEGKYRGGVVRFVHDDGGLCIKETPAEFAVLCGGSVRTAPVRA